ncbi:hypothetical protein G837_04335 [Escherichia coli HVH 185 (4-2876639)]|nr:hypothetical protein G837_04335 [Escherichia coli HVH 185 (4-2876639)]
MRRKRLIRPTFGSGCRPDKTQQRRIRHWLPDAAQAPYPAQVLLLPPDFHLGTEGPLVAVATTEATAVEISRHSLAVVWVG